MFSWVGADPLVFLLTSPGSWWIWPLLPSIAFVAGLVDTIAGGGGMIVLPALLAVGVPPHLALGTNKLQSSFGSFTAALRFRSAGLVRFREVLPGIAATAFGAGLGAFAVGLLDGSVLKTLIPLLLSGIFLFVLFKPNFGKVRSSFQWPFTQVCLGGGLVLGFYDGFFGPGTGTFWAMVLVGLAGLDLRAATANTKVFNFTSNAVGLSVFLWGGQVSLVIGFLMAGGQVLGAWAGSHLVIRRGAALIRYLLLVTTALMVVYLWLR